MSVRAAPKVGLSLEYLLWIFLRLSGLMMILFGFIGVAGAFAMQARIYFSTGGVVDIGTLARWTFFPIPTHVSAYGVEPLQWGHAWWQVMQYLMLFFAVTHGMDGVRQVIEDYVGNNLGRLLIRTLLFVAWLVFLIVGVMLIQGNVPQ